MRTFNRSRLCYVDGMPIDRRKDNMDTGTMIAARHAARIDAVAFISNLMARRADEVGALVAAMRASASNRAYRWPGGVWALQPRPTPRLPGESDRDYLARASHRRAHPTAPRWTALVVLRAARHGRVRFVDPDTIEVNLLSGIRRRGDWRGGGMS